MQPHLEAVTLDLRRVLEEPNEPIEYIYFLEAGIASVVAKSARDHVIEAGIIGCEGMTGLAVVLGDDRSPHSTYMQIAGRGMRMKAEELRHAMQESASLQRCFLRFAHTFMTQTAHTALANGRATVEQRLARWILMAHDRMDQDEIPLTHEFLSLMLGARRAGVTVALHLLGTRELIRAKRGLVVVTDRAGLEKFADGIYGIPEAELRRLTGWSAKGSR